jgi:hypothetical protein
VREAYTRESTVIENCKNLLGIFIAIQYLSNIQQTPKNCKQKSIQERLPSFLCSMEFDNMPKMTTKINFPEFSKQIDIHLFPNQKISFFLTCVQPDQAFVNHLAILNRSQISMKCWCFKV